MPLTTNQAELARTAHGQLMDPSSEGHRRRVERDEAELFTPALLEELDELSGDAWLIATGFCVEKLGAAPDLALTHHRWLLARERVRALRYIACQIDEYAALVRSAESTAAQQLAIHVAPQLAEDLRETPLLVEAWTERTRRWLRGSPALLDTPYDAADAPTRRALTDSRAFRIAYLHALGERVREQDAAARRRWNRGIVDALRACAVKQAARR